MTDHFVESYRTGMSRISLSVRDLNAEQTGTPRSSTKSKSIATGTARGRGTKRSLVGTTAASQRRSMKVLMAQGSTQGSQGVPAGSVKSSPLVGHPESLVNSPLVEEPIKEGEESPSAHVLSSANAVQRTNTDTEHINAEFSLLIYQAIRGRETSPMSEMEPADRLSELEKLCDNMKSLKNIINAYAGNKPNKVHWIHQRIKVTLEKVLREAILLQFPYFYVRRHEHAQEYSVYSQLLINSRDMLLTLADSRLFDMYLETQSVLLVVAGYLRIADLLRSHEYLVGMETIVTQMASRVDPHTRVEMCVWVSAVWKITINEIGHDFLASLGKMLLSTFKRCALVPTERCMVSQLYQILKDNGYPFDMSNGENSATDKEETKHGIGSNPSQASGGKGAPEWLGIFEGTHASPAQETDESKYTSLKSKEKKTEDHKTQSDIKQMELATSKFSKRSETKNSLREFRKRLGMMQLVHIPPEAPPDILTEDISSLKKFARNMKGGFHKLKSACSSVFHKKAYPPAVEEPEEKADQDDDRGKVYTFISGKRVTLRNQRLEWKSQPQASVENPIIKNGDELVRRSKEKFKKRFFHLDYERTTYTDMRKKYLDMGPLQRHLQKGKDALHKFRFQIYGED